MKIRTTSIIAAITRDTRALGKDGALLFSLPEDMKRFRTLTSEHPVIMGRKTWESLPEQFRPLPNRTNIVVTRQSDYTASGAIVVTSIDSALATAAEATGSEEVFIIGGGELYQAALPFIDRLYLTLVQADVLGDTFFPEYETTFTKEIEKEEYLENAPPYTFITLEK